jgi:hypothetical protein
MLSALGPRVGGTLTAVSDVARWIAARASVGSPLHVLPLLPYVEEFRQQMENESRSRPFLVDRQWSTPHAQLETERCYERWFASPARKSRTILPDLHLLAHALWAGGMYRPAAEVFAAIGPYALTTPWSLHGDPARTFNRARERCLSDL